MLLPCSLFGQTQQTIELANLYKSAKLKVVNRDIEIVSSDTGAYLKVSEVKRKELYGYLLRISVTVQLKLKCGEKTFFNGVSLELPFTALMI